MKCRDARRDLVAYLDHSMDRPRAEELESHLAECRACASEMESLRATLSLLREEVPPEVPAGVLVNLLPRVRMRLEEKKRARTQLLPRFAYASAAALAVLVALLLFKPGMKPETVSVRVVENGSRWVSLLQELMSSVDVEAVELYLLDEEPFSAPLSPPEYSEEVGGFLAESLSGPELEGLEESLQESSNVSVSDWVEGLDESEMEDLVALMKDRWGKE